MYTLPHHMLDYDWIPLNQNFVIATIQCLRFGIRHAPRPSAIWREKNSPDRDTESLGSCIGWYYIFCFFFCYFYIDCSQYDNPTNVESFSALDLWTLFCQNNLLFCLGACRLYDRYYCKSKDFLTKSLHLPFILFIKNLFFLSQTFLDYKKKYMWFKISFGVWLAFRAFRIYPNVPIWLRTLCSLNWYIVILNSCEKYLLELILVTQK